jgi:type VII secretion-associated serine protease mycosin
VTGLTHHRRGAVARFAAAALLAVAGCGLATGLTPVPAYAAVLPAAGPVYADAIRDEQWQLGALDAAAAWRYSRGAGVTVAVVDSGVDATHPDLVGQVLPGLDLVSGGDGRRDPVGHGTTVAALVAGRGDDQRGVVGLAPDAKILPVRVLDEDNRYDDAIIVAKAVRWAVDSGARVVNLSLGGVGDSAALAEALDYAFAKDVVVVACTGNVGPAVTPDAVWYPAREPGVVAVAGLDHHDLNRLWPSSITGSATVLTAPAADLLGARPGGYWRVQGTSFASPLVAATAALIRSRWPEMSAANVVNRLIRTAGDLGPAGRDATYGFGAVDPVAALTTPVAAVDHNPLDTTPPPGIGRFGRAPGTTADITGPIPQSPGAPPSRASGAYAGGAAAPAITAAPAADGPRRGLLGAAAGVALLVVVGLLVARRIERAED